MFDLSEMPGSGEGEVAAVGQKADVPCPVKRFEARAGDQTRQRLLLGRRDDHVARAGHDQRRRVDPPESFRNVVRLQQGESTGRHALVGFPATIDHKLGRRTGFGRAAVQQVEKLVDEAVVGRQRKPLQHSPRDRRGECRPKPRPSAVDDQRADLLGLLARQLQRDRAAERDAQDRRPFQPKTPHYFGQVVRIIPNFSRPRSTHGEPIAPKPADRDLESLGQPQSQRRDQSPTSRQSGHPAPTDHRCRAERRPPIRPDPIEPAVAFPPRVAACRRPFSPCRLFFTSHHQIHPRTDQNPRCRSCWSARRSTLALFPVKRICLPKRPRDVEFAQTPMPSYLAGSSVSLTRFRHSAPEAPLLAITHPTTPGP